MENIGFEINRWDHWGLVVSFVGIASCGLWLSWQWRIARYQQRRRRSHQNAGYIGSTSQLPQRQSLRYTRSRPIQVQRSRQLARPQNHHAP